LIIFKNTVIIEPLKIRVELIWQKNVISVAVALPRALVVLILKLKPLKDKTLTFKVK